VHYFSLQGYLYLRLSENSIIFLISPNLSSNNYHSWSRFITKPLSAKIKLKFIDWTTQELDKKRFSLSSMKRMQQHGDFGAFGISSYKANHLVDGRILNDLKCRFFFQGNILRILELQMKVSSLKQ